MSRVGQFIKRSGPYHRLRPARNRPVNRLNFFECTHRAGIADAFAVRDPVIDADINGVQSGQHINLGQRQAGKSVQLTRVPERNQIQPAAPSQPTGSRPEFNSGRLQKCSG